MTSANLICVRLASGPRSATETCRCDDQRVEVGPQGRERAIVGGQRQVAGPPFLAAHQLRQELLAIDWLPEAIHGETLTTVAR